MTGDKKQLNTLQPLLATLLLLLLLVATVGIFETEDADYFAHWKRTGKKKTKNKIIQKDDVTFEDEQLELFPRTTVHIIIV